ncbi:MAG TPA: transposase, partial [Vicinamibacteria bacterium]|nr:transposase [Vicinamibacteria bacterium]
MATALQTVLGETAAAAAQVTEFVKRRSKLGGAPWVQTLVFGWLANPDASLGELSQTAASLGVAISPQGLDQRFGPEAAACLEAVLAASLTEVVRADPVTVPLLARFPAVYIQDTTTITLPDALAGEWRGCDGGAPTGTAPTGTAAAVKAQVRLDLCQGSLHGPLLEDGRTADQRLAPAAAEVPVGSVLVHDLGYFAVATLAEADAVGRFWLTRLKVQTAIYEANGRRWEVGALLAARPETALDLPVRLGARQRLACRLLAVRVPPTVAAERRRKLRRAVQAKGRPLSAARLAVADWTIL